ncbi:Inner membrane protein CreD [hydrothermal vent metagenome]|uniref:Inner membrane protein CreD n=1 Tax=hydrothermal vent metagenome TaxID=652676 RepID=A0A3B1AFP3_9ZZZZ
MTLDSIQNWLRNSIFLRVLFIGFVVLLLQIPIAMIDSQISERDSTRNNAVHDISNKWGNQQRIIGPRLVVPFYELQSWTNKHGKKETRKKLRHAVFLPDSLNINAKIKNEIRYRGIFEVPVYQSIINLTGHFSKPDFDRWGITADKIYWDRAQLLVNVSDSRAIQKQVVLRWNTQSLNFEPGLGDTNSHDAGFHIPNIPLKNNNDGYKFNIAMVLNGSRSLYLAPMAKNTAITMSSDWPDPSFQGFKLPNNRNVTAQGFDADWAISHISRNYPQQWLHDTFDYNKFSTSLVGVDFISPVDNYRMSERSIKYQLLFLLLTFVAIWLLEIVYKLRIHLLQYLFLGLGMCLFYLLLLAFSEHISFFWSYIIASTAIVAMTTLYSKTILKTSKRASLIGTGITLLYIYLYSLLQEQNYSMLSGSIGVFVALAIIMYVTRNIDWYNLSKRGE